MELLSKDEVREKVQAAIYLQRPRTIQRKRQRILAFFWLGARGGRGRGGGWSRQGSLGQLNDIAHSQTCAACGLEEDSKRAGAGRLCCQDGRFEIDGGFASVLQGWISFLQTQSDEAEAGI